MASRWKTLVIATIFALPAINSVMAQDKPAQTLPAPSVTIPQTTCKTPLAQVSAAGFTLACNKRIPTGTFLGAYLVSALDGLSECVNRCTADGKCVALSLDNRDIAKRICTLFGSIESQSDAQDWIVGLRIPEKPVFRTAPVGKSADIQWLQDTSPTLTKMTRVPSDVTSFNRAKSSSTSGPFSQYSNILGSKTIASITGQKAPTDTGAWVNIPPPSDPKNIEIWGKPLVPTADMKSLQPVYFATDRTLPAGPLTEASFTDEPTLQLTYGYAVVSIPTIHVIGNVERPKFKWYKLGVEAESDANAFRVKAIATLDRSALVDQLKTDSDSIMLFIHGYNVSFTDAIFRAAQIAFDANFAGTVVVFSWPSAGNMFKYDKDRESAEAASPHLAQLLQLVSSDIGKKNVYVVAHSMGNQILVNALQQLALAKSPIGISELVMAAPDVDKNVYLSKGDQIRSVAKNITLYASSADKALLASGDKTFGTRIGYVGPTGPSIFPGIETIDVTAVGDDMFGLNHSTFSTSRVVLDDVGHLLRSLGHLAPDMRTPTLRLMPDKQHVQYWLYPP
ncbi:alpha/beta hydrolase [Bradyrhizobium sp. 197]|uniref:alpha/beta hydrolase n=1 Tax=Bradyrhizobium sp. 197 TaxID=2782663 RepID=UPI001FF87CD6|nr:alpha/beta fold hydrolase [Bradyrhizobium sp. 197]MCK1479451.1 alpha/beta hydrolase [Bradyrhizobium sp. 197]